VTDNVPFVDLRAAHSELGDRLDDAVMRVTRSGRYLFGPEVEAFEGEFARYCGTERCVAVASGLSALELALRAAGIGAGDEVVVPAYTAIPTWVGVSRAGATPVGVDVLERTYNIDPDRVEAAITDRTAAIVPVHLRGEPADVEPIREIAGSRGLFLLEDAAHAHGARRGGRRAGSLGNAAAFSFYPGKNLGALGDGGAVTTDDADLADRIRALRNYGSTAKHELDEIGFNSRLAEIQAAVLREKLTVLDEWNARRANLASLYRDELEAIDEIELPRQDEDVDPVWHLFVVGHPDRDRCRELLASAGVETGLHYPVAPPSYAPYRNADPRPPTFPVAERLAARCLSLPMYPQMDPEACGRVATILRGA
jgi:dTDP-4-amino-4,6-dideoxygalactose transaminase